MVNFFFILFASHDGATMRQSKLVKAVSELGAWELRHLADYVHSPFFNKHDRLTLLMDLIISAAPDFTTEALAKEHAYRLVFEGADWDEQRFKDLMSLGMKLFKSFLAFYRLRKDEFTQGLALLDELRERDWEQEFSKSLQQVQRLADTQQGQSQEKVHRSLKLHEALFNFQGAAKGRKMDDSVTVATDLLDSYYLIYRLKFAVEMANRRNVIGQEYEPGLLQPILDYLQAHPTTVGNNLGLRIYLLIYQLLTGTDAERPFGELLGILHEGIGQLQVTERREIYGYAINFCIQQINRGQSTYLAGLLDLYQRALDDETLLTEGWLSQWDYKNIVTSGLKARRFEWCEAFIEQYKAKIEPSARDNAYTYNLASLHAEQGDYRQALKLLQHVEFSDQFYHLGAKVILLKSYLELQDYEALHHLCETFRMYLKRNTELSKYHQAINMNLISLTKKLADLQSRWPGMGGKERRAQLEKMQAAIQEKGNVAQKAWLQEKVAALSV